LRPESMIVQTNARVSAAIDVSPFANRPTIISKRIDANA
jgi:hypothetical protein